MSSYSKAFADSEIDLVKASWDVVYPNYTPSSGELGMYSDGFLSFFLASTQVTGGDPAHWLDEYRARNLGSETSIDEFAPGTGPTVTVSSAAELSAALNSAGAGTTILLQSGDYGGFSLGSKSFAGPVTVRSADGDGGAVFSSLSFNGVSNLIVDSVTVNRPFSSSDAEWIKLVSIQSSSNIALVNSTVTGSTDDKGYGIHVGGSTGIIVENNDIFGLRKGAQFFGSQDLVFRDNYVHDVREDGVNFAGVSDVLIEGNYMRDFRPGSGDHADFIQFWTQGSGGSDTVTIRNNVLLEGEGAHGIQGMLIGDKGTAFYTNFTIEGNLYYGSAVHGITGEALVNSTVRNNTVLTVQEGPWTAGINVHKSSSNNVVEDNVATAFGGNSGHASFVNNITASTSDPSSPAYVGNLFATAFPGDLATLADFTAKAGGLLDGADLIGAIAAGTTSLSGNARPIAVGEALGTIAEDSAGITVAASSLLGNDGDADGDALSITGISNVVGGTVTTAIGAGGAITSITFTPAPDFSGTARFDYTVSDGNGGRDSATATIGVSPVNDAPVASGETAGTVAVDDADGIAISAASLLANDSDVDGDALAITAVSNVVGGSVTTTTSAGGAITGITFVPDAGFTGTARFDYAVSDGQGGTDAASATVNVVAAGSSTTIVSSTAELQAALAGASGGETILLAAGQYADLDIDGMPFASTVTIRSADGEGGAVFSNISVSNSANIVFDDVTVAHPLTGGEGIGTRAVWLIDSTDVGFTNSEIYGSTDGNFANDPVGIGITGVTGLTLEGNTFHDLTRGAVIAESDDVTVRNNTVTDIREDGFDFTGVVGALIEGNRFSDFHPVSGDHPDFIQFWTLGASRETENIVIRNNVMLQGDGAPVQGIFANNEVAGFEYRNFTVEGNVYYGDHWHGISFFDLNGGTIENNTVLSQPNAVIGPPMIHLNGTTGVTVEDNVTSHFYLLGDTGTTLTNNVVAQYADPSAPDYVGNLFVDGWAQSAATQADLAPAAGSLLTAGTPIGALDANGNFVVASNGGGTIASDRISGTPGADVFIGVAGNAAMLSSAVGATFDGGNGFDVLSYSNNSEGITATMIGRLSGTVSTALGKVDSFSTIEQVIGSTFGDTFIGGIGNDVFLGGGGDDTLSGFSGNDYLDGGDGNDRLYGGNGNDRFVTGSGNDIVEGNAGYDVLRYSNSLEAITVSSSGPLSGTVSTATGENDMFSTVEQIDGTKFDDTFLGGAGNDVFVGGGGDDTLHGATGNDYLAGGDGNDRLHGGDGNDRLYGGDGSDVIVTGAGNDVAVGNGGYDVLDYSSASEGITVSSVGPLAGTVTTLSGEIDTFSSIEQIEGSAFGDVFVGGVGNDVFLGGGGDDTLSGLSGNDYLAGGDGDDRLSGGAGSDRILGNSGNDRLEGGTGDDTLIGGAGNDIFVFHAGDGNDTVSDFGNGADVLDYSSQAGLGFFDLSLVQSGANAVITNAVTGDTVTLIGVDVGSLAQDDFVFQSISNGGDILIG